MYMKGGLIMLMIRSTVIGNQEGKYWSNIGRHTLCKPIDETDDALVDFCALFEIGAVRVSYKNGVDGVTGSICHRV